MCRLNLSAEPISLHGAAIYISRHVSIDYLAIRYNWFISILLLYKQTNMMLDKLCNLRFVQSDAEVESSNRGLRKTKDKGSEIRSCN